MNQHPQPRETPAPLLKATTAGDARKLAETLMDVMSALLGVIERETELVRAGKVAEAMALEPNKTDLSRRYVSAVEHLKASQPYLSQAAPELLTTSDAGPAPHDAARAQPVALISFRFGVFADCGHFSSNLRAIFSAAFIAFSNRTLIAAGHSC